jgi:cytidylate kinase
VSIITITTDAYSNGRTLAESVARNMGYPCIGDEIVALAAERYKVAEAKLVQALETSPSFFDRLSSRRPRYTAYLEAVLTEKMLNHDLVYHGFIGITRIQQVSHAFKVRVVANMEDRIPVALKKENLSEKVEARDRIFKYDVERKRWAKAIYGIDISDSAL